MTESIDNNKFPWESSVTTKNLLLRLVKDSDETEKIDFKLDFNIHGPKTEKDELMLDMASIANSYSSNYDNHGFLIVGIDSKTKEIKGSNIDKEELTTHIDERMAKFLSPHIRFTVELYDIEHSKKKWGAIIIKTGIELPHIFTADRGGFKKGEVWVRKGSHKCLADSTDFSRFFRIRTESLKRDQDQLEAKINLLENDLKKRIESLDNKILVTPNLVQGKSKVLKKEEVESACPENIKETLQDNKDLLSLVKKELPKHSQLEFSLLKEVQSGLIFLESDDIPWTLKINNENKQEAIDTVQLIQEKFEKYYRALFELSFFGNKDDHTKLIINSVQKLAKYIHRGGVTYDALYVRYLPLVTALHIISMAAVYRKNPSLLKKVISLDLFNKNRHETKYSITESLFKIRGASEVFNALHPGYPDQKWCDAVGVYLKQYFSSMLSNYDEFEDPEALFYQGEFLLTLSPVIAHSEASFNRGSISSGSYIFLSEAQYILEEFLKNNKVFMEKIFGNDLKQVLENFDKFAPEMGNLRGGWSDGIPKSTVNIVFPENKIINTNK